MDGHDTQEGKQTQKTTCCEVPWMCSVQQGQAQRDRKRLVLSGVGWGLGGGEGEYLLIRDCFDEVVEGGSSDDGGVALPIH